MTGKLLEQLEALAGTDDFAYESEEIMEQMQEAGAGSEVIEALLGIMERHPADDFGMPGAMVHFIEQYHPAHIPLLIASLRRSPSLSAVWMLNRCINGGFNRAESIAVLREVAENGNAHPDVRASAKDFLEYQLSKG